MLQKHAKQPMCQQDSHISNCFSDFRKRSMLRIRADFNMSDPVIQQQVLSQVRKRRIWFHMCTESRV